MPAPICGIQTRHLPYPFTEYHESQSLLGHSDSCDSSDFGVNRLSPTTNASSSTGTYHNINLSEADEQLMLTFYDIINEGMVLTLHKGGKPSII